MVVIGGSDGYAQAVDEVEVGFWFRVVFVVPEPVAHRADWIEVVGSGRFDFVLVWALGGYGGCGVGPCGSSGGSETFGVVEEDASVAL